MATKRDDLQALVAKSNVDPKPSSVVARKKKKKKKKSVHTNDCQIIILNTDCLLKIFEYLSMSNLLAVEMVCSRWKAVAELLWRQFTEFDGRNLDHTCLNRSFRCLVRCGPYIKKIFFPPLIPGKTSVEFLNIVACRCPQVEHVVLNEIYFRTSYRRNLNKILKRLTHLEIPDNSFPISYKELKILFGKVPNLRCLTFSGNSMKNGLIISETMTHLPNTVTEIHFGSLKYLQPEFFEKLKENCPDVEVLTLTMMLTYENYAGEIHRFSKLKHLELKNCDIQVNGAIQIMSLSLLEKLALPAAVMMDDDLLAEFAKALPLLRYLDIHGPTVRNVTDKGLKKLAQLHNLEYLDISYYNLISFEGVGAIAAANINLTKLILISTSVTDAVIPAIINHCHKLRFLDLSGCLDITSDSVETLLRTFTLGNKRKQLTVILGGTEYMTAQLDIEVEGDVLPTVTAPNLVLVSDTNNINHQLQKIYDRFLNGGDDYFSEDDDDYDYEDDEDDADLVAYYGYLDYEDYDDEHHDNWFDYEGDNYEYQLDGIIDLDFE